MSYCPQCAEYESKLAEANEAKQWWSDEAARLQEMCNKAIQQLSQANERIKWYEHEKYGDHPEAKRLSELLEQANERSKAWSDLYSETLSQLRMNHVPGTTKETDGPKLVRQLQQQLQQANERIELLENLMDGCNDCRLSEPHNVACVCNCHDEFLKREKQ